MRAAKRIALGVILLAAASLLLVYAASAVYLRRDLGFPLGHVAPDRSPAALVEGQRIARLYGCLSCHGEAGQGKLMADVPIVFRITAPPLSIAARSSDAELARTIRNGVGRRGNRLWIMPAHLRMADEDLARLMGYLRTLRPGPADIERRRSFGPLGRVLILAGRIPSESRIGPPAPAMRPASIGPYYVGGVCLGCHSLDKAQPFGGDGEIAPPLAPVGAAYDDAAFVRLLRTGHGLSRPALGTMSEVSRTAFRFFHDDEIAAIHAELRAQAARSLH